MFGIMNIIHFSKSFSEFSTFVHVLKNVQHIKNYSLFQKLFRIFKFCLCLGKGLEFRNLFGFTNFLQVFKFFLNISKIVRFTYLFTLSTTLCISKSVQFFRKCLKHFKICMSFKKYVYKFVLVSRKSSKIFKNCMQF